MEKDQQNQNNDTIHVVEELRDVEHELQDFEDKQTSITRTLQMIVYPAMVAFIILAAYGFYLVQSLTSDVHRLTETITVMQGSVNKNMATISDTMLSMNNQFNEMVSSTDQMSDNIKSMTQNIQQMNNNTAAMTTYIQQMNVSTQNMAVSTYNMQHDMWYLNKNISGPMKMFNKFNPFGGSDTVPYVVPPPPVTSYYPNYYAWPYNVGTQLSTPAVVPAQSVTVPTKVTSEPSNSVVNPQPVPAAVGNDQSQLTPTNNPQLIASAR